MGLHATILYKPFLVNIIIYGWAVIYLDYISCYRALIESWYTVGFTQSSAVYLGIVLVEI
jgi:hypothetical protein